MSEHEKLDTWGKWRRDAIQDYGSASSRYMHEGRKFMSALAAIGEAAADLAPHSAKGVAFELATMATGLGPVSRALGAAGAAKNIISAVKLAEHGAEVAHLGASIEHSVKNIAKAVVPPAKTGSLNSVKGTGIYTTLPSGFLKSAMTGKTAVSPKSATGSRNAPFHGSKQKAGPHIIHGATVLASKMEIHTLGSKFKSALVKPQNNTMSLMNRKLSMPKTGIKSSSASHMSLMNRKLNAPKPMPKPASSMSLMNRKLNPQKLGSSMNTIRRAAPRPAPRPVSRPMGRR